MFEVGESRVELLGLDRARLQDRRLPGAARRRAFTTSPTASTTSRRRSTSTSALGLRTLDTCPRRGAAGRLVAFLHPSAAVGVLTELCQPDPDAAEHGE